MQMKERLKEKKKVHEGEERKEIPTNSTLELFKIFLCSMKIFDITGFSLCSFHPLHPHPFSISSYGYIYSKRPNWSSNMEPSKSYPLSFPSPYVCLSSLLLLSLSHTILHRAVNSRKSDLQSAIIFSLRCGVPHLFSIFIILIIIFSLSLSRYSFHLPLAQLFPLPGVLIDLIWPALRRRPSQCYHHYQHCCGYDICARVSLQVSML